MMRMGSVLRDQRGSALLISMVLIVVITILGLALFELGQIEGQHSGASLGDARAFEVAQAGMERAIRELSNAFLADPYGSESWVDGPSRPTCAGVRDRNSTANAVTQRACTRKQLSHPSRCLRGAGRRRRTSRACRPS